MSKALALIAVVALALFACLLVFVGLAISLRTQDSSDPRDASVPLTGFLITTVGAGVSVAACRIAAKLGAAKSVEGVVGFFFSFFGISALISLAMFAWQQHTWPSGLPPSGLVWFTLAVPETMAVLIWLLTRDKRARKNLDHVGR